MNKIDEAIADRLQLLSEAEICSYESLEVVFIELDAIASMLMVQHLADLATEALNPSEVFGRLKWVEESTKVAEFEALWRGNQYTQAEDEEFDWQEAEECRTELVKLLKIRLQ